MLWCEFPPYGLLTLWVFEYSWETRALSPRRHLPVDQWTERRKSRLLVICCRLNALHRRILRNGIMAFVSYRNIRCYHLKQPLWHVVVRMMEYASLNYFLPLQCFSRKILISVEIVYNTMLAFEAKAVVYLTEFSPRIFVWDCFYPAHHGSNLCYRLSIFL